MNTKIIIGAMLIFVLITASGQSLIGNKYLIQKQAKMEQQRFIAKKKTWTRFMHAQAKAEEVFPLLCPVREYDWIPQWSCNMVFSESGVAEDLCVFKTHFSPEECEETWVCTYYEKNTRIEYLYYLPNRITRLRITLKDDKPAASDWEWQTSVIGLNDSGNEYIESMDQSRRFFTQNETLEEDLNYYLQNHQIRNNH